MEMTKTLEIASAGLTTLGSLAERLNAETARLDNALRKIERRLVALGLDTEIWRAESLRESNWEDVLDGNGDSTREWRCQRHELGFCQLGDEWGLGVRVVRLVKSINSYGGEYCETLDTGSGIEPLLSAKRELRLAAVSVLPGLIVQITKVVEQALKTVGVAQALANGLGEGA